MGLSLGEIAGRYSCELHGDPDTVVDHVATLVDAGDGSTAFLANAAYRGQLETTRAACVILAPDDRDACPTAALVTPNPYAVYARVATELHPAVALEPVPWELEAVVLKAMATDPDARYADVAALRAVLSATFSGGVSHAFSAWAGAILARRAEAQLRDEVDEARARRDTDAASIASLREQSAVLEGDLDRRARGSQSSKYNVHRAAVKARPTPRCRPTRPPTTAQWRPRRPAATVFSSHRIPLDGCWRSSSRQKPSTRQPLD